MASEIQIIMKNTKEFREAIEAKIAIVDAANKSIVSKGGQVIAREAKKVFLGSPTKKGPNGRGKGQQGQKSTPYQSHRTPARLHPCRGQARRFRALVIHYRPDHHLRSQGRTRWGR